MLKKISDVLCFVFAFSLIGFGVVACESLTQQVGSKAAKAIKRYCEEPASVRMTLREQVNDMIAPNSVIITCQEDTSL